MKPAKKLQFIFKDKPVDKNHCFCYIYVLRISCLFLETTLEDAVMYLPRYQDSLRKMKEDDYEIIGYARKLKGEKDDMKRESLLNPMAEKLKTRSLTDRVFISPNSSAGYPFNKRDENKREELMSSITADGDTQDIPKYISDRKKKVILVTID